MWMGLPGGQCRGHGWRDTKRLSGRGGIWASLWKAGLFCHLLAEKPPWASLCSSVIWIIRPTSLGYQEEAEKCMFSTLPLPTPTFLLFFPSFFKSQLWIWEGEREMRDNDSLFYLSMHSWADSHRCPDWGQNPQPWHVGQWSNQLAIQSGPFLLSLLKCPLGFYLVSDTAPGTVHTIRNNTHRFAFMKLTMRWND